MCRRYIHQREGANVDAVDQDRPLRNIVEAADEVHDRGLAGAAGPDQTDHLAGWTFRSTLRSTGRAP